jgi:hypothetical protein
MNFSIKCGKCGCEYNPKPLVVETGAMDESGSKVFKVIGEDSSCPQCSRPTESFTESTTKRLLCG